MSGLTSFVQEVACIQPSYAEPFELSTFYPYILALHFKGNDSLNENVVNNLWCYHWVFIDENWFQLCCIARLADLLHLSF